MNDYVFALPAFLLLYVVGVAVGGCPITGAIVLTVLYVSMGFAA